jgi:hypothetical protein
MVFLTGHLEINLRVILNFLHVMTVGYIVSPYDSSGSFGSDRYS